MKKIYGWFNRLPKQIQDSIFFSVTVVGFVSTLFTVLGVSLKSIPKTTIWMRIGIIVLLSFALAILYYFIVENVFKDSVTLNIAETSVEICCGDIFQTSGMKVIGCDNHFDTRVDDVVITKTSLHGKMILEHGNVSEIKKVVEKEAHKASLKKNKAGLYDFPLGTIIKYESSIDGQTYLMLAVAELDEQNKARTNMAEFELMLMKMWQEIDRVYASHDVILPILGAGILRFGGPKNKEALLRCMLCTFNSSGVSLNSKVKIVIYGNAKEIPLYECKNIFNVILRR